MHNVFKSKLVLVNSKFPFVPEIRHINEDQSHLIADDGNYDCAVNNEKEIDLMFKKAKNEAERIVIQANIEAQEILTQSLIQSDNLKRESSRNGYEQGFNQGLKNAKEDCVCLIDEILAIREQIIAERSRLYSDLEQDMVKLSLEISKKVIYEQLSDDGEAFVKLVQSTVQKVRSVDFVKIWVSSVDHAKLYEMKDTLLSSLKNIKDLKILKGDSIKSWGCIVDTENGVLDGGVETRIAQIQELLIAADENESS